MAVATPTSATDTDWVADLKEDPAFAGLDVDREHAKMRRWCGEHHKQPTRRRFINWLNRADRPLAANQGLTNTKSQFTTGEIQP